MRDEIERWFWPAALVVCVPVWSLMYNDAWHKWAEAQCRAKCEDAAAAETLRAFEAGYRIHRTEDMRRRWNKAAGDGVDAPVWRETGYFPFPADRGTPRENRRELARTLTALAWPK